MRLLVAFAAGVIAGCGLSSQFACEGEAQCETGICQPTGWCSFPDDSCPSGQRYGEHSGDGLGQMCVDVDGTTGAQDDGDGTTQDLDDGETTTRVDDSNDASTAALDGSDELGGSSSHGDGPATLDGSESTGSSVELPDPIAWYSFDDPQDMFADVSGNAHHAWCVTEFDECPIPVAGIVGVAVEFAGAVEHAHIDDAPWLATTTELSIAVWVLPGVLTDTYQSIVAKPLGATTGSSWGVGLASMATSVEARIETANEMGLAVGEFPADGEWHHVTSVWDGSEVRVYVDGVLAGSGPASAIEFDGHPASIGAGVDTELDASFFVGTLDELRFYDVALSDDAVAVLATSP